MSRPRWHDALLVVAITGILAIGVWSLWWDDVRSALHLGPAGDSDDVAAPIAQGQT
jgi:hypothetical protein